MNFKKKLDYNDEKQTPLNDLKQKLVQEHQKTLENNQNPNKLKHFIVEDDTILDIEIDILVMLCICLLRTSSIK